MPLTRRLTRREKAARAIQRVTRALFLIWNSSANVITRSSLTVTMAFLLNPLDATLDLSDKENRKLFKAGTKGLSDDLKLTGEEEKFNGFRKLIGERIRKVRLMEALN
eukprot:2306416-Ditylum_brightwellii.AAC.1